MLVFVKELRLQKTGIRSIMQKDVDGTIDHLGRRLALNRYESVRKNEVSSRYAMNCWGGGKGIICLRRLGVGLPGSHASAEY